MRMEQLDNQTPELCIAAIWNHFNSREHVKDKTQEFYKLTSENNREDSI